VDYGDQQSLADLRSFRGKWNITFERFRDRMYADVFQRLFAVDSDGPDMEHAMMDAALGTAHPGEPRAKPSAGLRAA